MARRRIFPKHNSKPHFSIPVEKTHRLIIKPARQFFNLIFSGKPFFSTSKTISEICAVDGFLRRGYVDLSLGSSGQQMAVRIG